MTTGSTLRPASISPTAFVDISLHFCHAHVDVRQALPSTGSILVVRERFMAVFEGLYAEHLPDRDGIIIAPGTGDQGHTVTLAALDPHPLLDVLVPIASDPREANIDVQEALHLAQQTNRVVIPAGIGCGTCWPFLRSDIPLPLTRIVAVIEAPFDVPEQPQEIPEAWTSMIIRLLKQADGRALDQLATWRKSGRL